MVVYLISLLKRQRRSLQDATARTREVLEFAPDAFLLAERDGRFSQVNQAACQLLGYPASELLGKRFVDFLPLEDAAKASAETYRAEMTLKRKDGGQVAVEMNASLLPDGRWQVFARDIRERKRVEDERQVFVSLLDNSSDFIGVADPTGKPVYLNPAGRRMVGLAPDFPVERIQIEDCYPEDVRPFARDVILKSMLERGRWSGDTFLRHWQTEQPIPVSDEHFLIRDADQGRLLGSGTIIRDRTDAEAANERLRESEERFRVILDEAPIGMALIGLDGRFVRVNRALCAIVATAGTSWNA